MILLCQGVREGETMKTDFSSSLSIKEEPRKISFQPIKD